MYELEDFSTFVIFCKRSICDINIYKKWMKMVEGNGKKVEGEIFQKIHFRMRTIMIYEFSESLVNVK